MIDPLARISTQRVFGVLSRRAVCEPSTVRPAIERNLRVVVTLKRDQSINWGEGFVQRNLGGASCRKMDHLPTGSLGISGNLRLTGASGLPYGLAQLERVLIQNSRWPASPPAFGEFCMSSY